ncbi:PAS domain-containing sensor histidine kinase [Cohnella sp. CIP 111063]|uniref:ATP-binding protein n=1 Tax=unclassified Cohnella TaxID=2636738 RepID=UPI000B8C3401|nr:MULTISPECIES: ATP-binding protein [unclassified Cohnella]OXS58422.1 PAS domain-containing sensor histidine kinase [Cohnella sp. CIP 111063]PRX71712.1 nitrogen-specific signal transduction histidine kinase [Cohnella sp. SGD-V74]
MNGWKTRYFPVLAEFARSGGHVVRPEMQELWIELIGLPASVILRHHEESVKFLLSYAEPEDRMTLVHRSLLFITELLVSLRLPEAAAAEEKRDEDKLLYNAGAIHSEHMDETPSNKFETVLQHMDSGVALFDAAGNLRFVNVQMSKLLKAPRKALIGSTLFRLFFHENLSRSIRKHVLRIYRGLALYRRYHDEFQDAAGRHLLVSISQPDELEGDYLVSVKDVSEYKLIEQAAFQNDKLAMLGKTAAAIAHEIRNPLTSIRGFIQLLNPYLSEIGKQEYGRIILSEIDRANDIIYEFLNSSKPSAPMKQKVLVDMLLRESILISESEANMQGCEIHCENFEPELTVAVDVKQIKQVLLNIMKNAIDAIQDVIGERKGRIDISARTEGRFAVISIRDNGKGMERAILNRLFDPFFTTKEAGTGLGLSVSYRIITNHGGTIQVNSQIREGTEFMIYLPYVE